MTQESIFKLRNMSTFCKFNKDEYICHEGEPGNEMYIILKGTVGIYLTNFFGSLTEIARIKDGDFFGEMAIFDNEPRSASCIALEETMCVAINKGNLREFFVNCPDLAELVVANMSNRIRHMNDKIYKNAYSVKRRNPPKFSIPSAYAFSHNVKEPYQNPKYFVESLHICPLCGRSFKAKSFSKHMMEVRSHQPDGKVEYVDGNPLWHEVYSCPNCHYSNHRLRFFQINAGNREQIKSVLQNEQLPVLQSNYKRTPFDMLVQHYLQAIHLNEVINQDNFIRIGMLWLNLYWLSKEVEDERFAKYCAQKTVKKFRAVLDAQQAFESDEKDAVALALANLLEYLEIDTDDILEYCTIAADSSNEAISSQAKIMVKKYSHN